MLDSTGTQGADGTYEWGLIFTCAKDQNPMWAYFLLSSWYTLLHEITVSSSHNCSLELPGIYYWLEYFLPSSKKQHQKKSVQSRETQHDQQVTLKVLTSCMQLMWQGLTTPTKNAEKMISASHSHDFSVDFCLLFCTVSTFSSKFLLLFTYPQERKQRGIIH